MMEPDVKVTDIIDWILFKLPPTRTTFTKDEITDILLDLRQEYNGR